jgi:hypothetical protein
VSWWTFYVSYAIQSRELSIGGGTDGTPHIALRGQRELKLRQVEVECEPL